MHINSCVDLDISHGDMTHNKILTWIPLLQQPAELVQSTFSTQLLDLRYTMFTSVTDAPLFTCFVMYHTYQYRNAVKLHTFKNSLIKPMMMFAFCLKNHS